MAMQRVGRGRASTSTTIVAVDKIIPEPRVLQENWCIMELGYIIRQPLSALQWLAQCRLIKNSMYCDMCQRHFGLNIYQYAADGYRWYCKGCKQQRSVSERSFISQRRLTL